MRATLKVDYGPGMLADFLDDAARLANKLDVSITFSGNGHDYVMFGVIGFGSDGSGVCLRYDPDGACRLGTRKSNGWSFKEIVESPVPVPFSAGYDPSIMTAASEAYAAIARLDQLALRPAWSALGEDDRQRWAARMLSAYTASLE